MSYDQKDRSVHDRAPIECYEFIADHKTWYLTSYHTRIQVAGQWYDPTQITRTAIQITSIIDANQTMDFNLPCDHELARIYCFTKPSPKNLKVIVRSVQEGDNYATEFKIEWTGRLAGAAGSGKWGVIKTGSLIYTQLNGSLSSVYYQKSCNHVLFDARCKVLREDYTVEAEVTKVQDQIITVDNDGNVDNALVGGMMVNTRTGEQQSIISNNFNVIRIGYPFFDILPGDTVELTLGCDHQRLGHCKTRFNNVVNYGGFDFIPEINPFEKLVYTTSVRTETREKLDVTFRAFAQTGTATRSSGGRRSYESQDLGSWNNIKKPNGRSITLENSVSEGSGNIPSSQIGSIVSGILGRKLVTNHNMIWTGNLRPVTETIVEVETVTEDAGTAGGGGGINVGTITRTITKKTTTTVGYLADILMGVGLGPDMQLRAIYVDETPVWTGTVGPARTQINIAAGDHFLGGKSVYFTGGAFNQAAEPLIIANDFPAHVGIATVLLKDIRVDAQMGQLGFEVVRVPNPLGLSAGVNREGDDMNIVSATVEVMTNPWGYGGLDISNFDTATFTAMALVTANEDNIVSVKIDNEAAVTEVLSIFQNQARMTIFENPELGLISGKLIRYTEVDYINMPRFHGRGNIIELRDFQKGGWQFTMEQAQGVFPERAALYQNMSVFVQNPANVSPSGRGKRTVSLAYPFVPIRSLALTLVSRDIAQSAAPLYQFNLLVNRDGAKLLPGDIITVTWDDYGILNVPMLVQTVRKQDMNNSNVVLGLRQIKYPDTRALLGPGGATYDPGFDVDPKMPSAVRILSAPYYMVRSANGITALETTPLNYPIFLAKPFNDFQATFQAFLNNKPDLTTPAAVTSNAGYATYAQLNGAINQYDGFDTGIIASIVVDGVVNKAYLQSVGNDGVRNGELFMFIGNEVLSFESATDNNDGTWTLGNVHRVLLDTVFQTHNDNSDVYIVGNGFFEVSDIGFTQPIGYVPQFGIVPNSVTKPGTPAQALLSTGYAPTVLRTLAPPRPHNTKINGNARSSTPVAITEGASVTVTWSTRNRASIDVALMLDAAQPDETNGADTQKHYVYHRSAGGVVTNIGNPAGYTGVNTATFTMPNVTDGAGTIYVQSEMDLNGFTYIMNNQDRIPVAVSP